MKRDDTTMTDTEDGVATVIAEIVTEATPIINSNSNSNSRSDGVATTGSGRWKSGLFSCCKYGYCHPALWCAWCFPMLFMGQLLTRMKLTWFGETPSSSASKEYENTFCTVATIWIISSVMASILYCPLQLPVVIDTPEITSGSIESSSIPTIEMIDNPECSYWKYSVAQLIPTLTGLYTVLVMIKLRKRIRTLYGITAGSPCEDCCCIWWCGCCTSIQMAHQTTEYEEVPAYCCTSTGLPPHYYYEDGVAGIHNDDTDTNGMLRDDDDDDDAQRKTITVFTAAVVV